MFTAMVQPTELERVAEVVEGHRRGVEEAQAALIAAQARLLAALELQQALRLGTA